MKAFYENCNTQVFNAWLQYVLLKKLPPNQTIVMDNVSFHKSKATKEIIEKAGHSLLYLPPYSPDLNPIEKFWANMKRYIKNERDDYESVADAMAGFFKKCGSYLIRPVGKKLKKKKKN